MKSLRPLFICLFLLYFSSNLSAQIFYVSSPNNSNNTTLGSNIYRVTVTPSGLSSQLINTCNPGDQFFSIAMNKDGFYWLNSGDIWKGNIIGNTLINCQVIAKGPYANALTVGPDNKLYYSDGNLYSTDLNTFQTKSLGNTRYSPQGDMSFYKGKLYQTGTGIDLIDINNPQASSVYMPLNLVNMFGLISVSTSLHKNTTYVLSVVAISPTRQTDVYEIDLDTKQVIGLIGSLPYQVLDAASPVEDGNILGVQINGVNVHQDCTNPTKGIAEINTTFNYQTLTYTLNNGVTNTTGMFSNLNPGNYTVTVTSSNDSQTSTFTVPVYNLNKPSYTYKIDNQVCDAPGQITFNTTNTDGYQIQFGTSVYPLNYTFTGLTTNNTYQFTVLNSQGCIVDALSLTVPRDKCTIQFDKTIIKQQCDAIHKGTVQAVTKAHNDAYTYTINNVSNSTGSFSGLSKGSYTLNITSPEDALNVPVIIPDYKLTQPDITYNAVDENCGTKGTIQFSIKDDPSLYKIQYGTNTYPIGQVFTNLSAGPYHFLVLTQTGCMVDEYDVQLNYIPCPIIINSVAIAPECHVLGQGFIQIKAQQVLPALVYTYTLNTGEVNKTGLFDFLSPDNYQVTVTSSDGGTPQKATITIPDYSLNKPASVIQNVLPVCDLTGQIKITVPADTTTYYLVYNGTKYPSGSIFSNLYEGTYHFDVLKNNGCIADAYDINLVREECDPVSFPSAFTPNGDGINDIFRADPKSKATGFFLKIFDRFGIIVFSSNDLHQGWDGYYKGRPMPMGVYYYISNFTDQKNVSIVLKGTTTLIR